MNKILLNRAYTLLELLISLMLVSVVVLGIFSISMVLNNNNQDYGQRYLVKSETQASLNHIINNVSLAVGSGTYFNLSSGSKVLDQGILIGGPCNPGSGGDLGCLDPVNNPNTFCIHQGAGNNIIPNNATTDIWLCYTYYGAGTATTATSGAYEIWYCASPYSLNALNRGALNCASAVPSGGWSLSPTFLGTAFTAAGTPLSTSFVDNAATGQLQFSITIQNCLNDAATDGNGNLTCQGSGTSSDQVNNPEVPISGSVTPPQEGI